MVQVPFAIPDVGEEEIAEVAKTLRSGWLTMGPKTREFEAALAKYTGAEHAVAVNSCTAALHLSLLAAGIGPGDEVITTPLTFAATANVIVHCGATPVFVDIDRDTFNISPEEIRKHVTPRTKAIIPVHYAGQPCKMSEIYQFVDLVSDLYRRDLVVIEDAAHAIGATYHGRKVGNLDSDTTCFSFYATKNMTTGEGGAITTNNASLAEQITRLRLHGMSKDAWKRYGPGQSWKYDIVDCGWKYNTTDLNSSLGLCQLQKLDAFNKRRRELSSLYTEQLEDIVTVPQQVEDDHVRHLYPIQVRYRDTFIEEMAKLNVFCSVHFIPLHMTEYYKQKYGYRPGFFPVCESIYSGLVSLPLFPKMSDDDALYVSECVKKVVDIK